MMKQIINWTCGSFFRTIGRLLVFILLGFIIANLVDFSDIISNFRITDLFFEKVNASVLTENVKYFETSYLATGQPNSTGWTNTDGMFYRNVHPISNEQIFSIGISSNDVITTNADYIQMSFSVEQPLSVDTTDYLNMGRCSQFDCSQYTSDGVCSRYYCSQLSPITSIGSVTNYDTTTITNMNFIVTANYTGGWSTCSIEGNSIFCPTLKRQLQSIDFHVNFDTLMDTYFKLSMHRSVTKYIYANQEIIDAINETSQQQMQQQQQQHNETMQTITDTNSTSDSNSASDFIHDYNETSQDSIKAIVSLPLNIFNALTTGSTQDLCFTLKGKQSCLPSGDILWGKTSRTSIHAGNATFTPHPFGNNDIPTGISAFKVLFNIVVSGYLGYKMLKSLMRITNNMLSPTHDKIEVLEL